MKVVLEMERWGAGIAHITFMAILEMIIKGYNYNKKGNL